MSKLTSLLMGAGSALVLSGCGQPQTPIATNTPPPVAAVDQAAEAAKARMAQQDIDINLVKAWYNPATTADERVNLMSPDLIEHNPQGVLYGKINKLNGRDIVIGYFETLSKLRGGGGPYTAPPRVNEGPQPPPSNKMYKIMADGDLVTDMHENYKPVPGKSGQFYPVFSWDTWRVRDGKFAEHWDAAVLPERLPIYLSEPASKIHFPKQTKPISLLP